MEIKEELQGIVDGRSEEMFESYILVRKAFQQPYEWPEIDTLRHEVCLCLIFGLYQAAMTMTNHMLESFLKFSLSYKHTFNNLDGSSEDRSTQGLVESLRPGFKKYNSKNLYQSIEAAYKANLITDEQKDQLHVIRDAFRNAYSHADKEKIHGDKEIPIQ